jgi:hypothetical protein
MFDDLHPSLAGLHDDSSPRRVEQLTRIMQAPPSAALPSEHWTDRAACLGASGDLWFPDRGLSKERSARRMCWEICTVREQCLDDSLRFEEQHGIRGGLNDKERKRIIRDLKRSDSWDPVPRRGDSQAIIGGRPPREPEHREVQEKATFRDGDSLAEILNPGDVDRFLAHVDTSAGPDACWPWQGHRVFFTGGVRSTVARVAYVIDHGADVPAGLEVVHTCHYEAVSRDECAGGDTCLHRGCVNPTHLALVSSAERLRRSLSTSPMPVKKTHCTRGHPLSGDNLYLTQHGARFCRACDRLRGIAYRARKQTSSIDENRKETA